MRESIHGESGDLSLDLISNYQKDSPGSGAFKSIAYHPTDPATGHINKVTMLRAARISGAYGG